ncbi:hypothetical protein GmHk_15G044609 [Glycine max]|nr:hypothetical protein GmHk_15G044609 [Glycine max]
MRAITSDSGSMHASCNLQSELRMSFTATHSPTVFSAMAEEFLKGFVHQNGIAVITLDHPKEVNIFCFVCGFPSYELIHEGASTRQTNVRGSRKSQNRVIGDGRKSINMQHFTVIDDGRKSINMQHFRVIDDGRKSINMQGRGGMEECGPEKGMEINNNNNNNNNN